MEVLKPNKDSFLNRSTIIYGGSACGKTSIIKDILYNLKGEVTAAVVICPTEPMNGTYTDGHPAIIPKQFLHTEYRDSLVTSIFKFQEERIKQFKKINSIKTLETIYKNYPSETIDITIERMQQLIAKELCAIQKMPPGEQYAAKSAMEEKYNDTKLMIYKTHIKTFKEKFLNYCKNSDDLVYIIKNIDFNPNMVFIIDDGSSIMDAVKNNDLITKLATENRHFRTTFILAVHASKVVAPLLRTNAHNSIFTDKKTAGGYIEANKSQYTLKDRKAFQEKVQFITMNNESHLPTHMKNRKLFFSNVEQKYYIYKAELREPYALLPDNLIKFAESIKKPEN